MDNKLDTLKNEYVNVPVPDELDFIVRKAIKKGKEKSRKGRNSFMRNIRIAAASVAAIAVVLIAGVNTSQVFASTLSRLPVVGGLVKVITFREYSVNEDKYNLDLKVPSVQGMENKSLEAGLNEKYLSENKALYERFMKDMEDLKKTGGGHMGVNSGYEIKTDTDSILSIGRYVVNTVGSSSTTFKFDTIDKKKEVLLTLPSLFKDSSYIDLISENIKKQMVEQNTADSKKFYWVSGIEQNGQMKLFDKIAAEQNFYINADGKLVISFDKYEVAPGYMGIVQFVIPSDILKNVLVSNEYIK